MDTLEYVRAYLDDLLVILRKSFEDYLEKLKEVLKRLQKAGLKVNAAKSTFGVHECEYLGYVLTREGIKPQTKKIEAILAIARPKNVRTLRGFLGMVQYYRDIWEKRSEMLAPLTDLVAECGLSKTEKAAKKKKRGWYWTDVHERAFQRVKETIARDVMLAYPDFSKPFEIYTDACATQLGAVITQNNRPIAFFSRKLSDTQKRYTVTEQELLAIVETLKEFKGMLWGQKIKIYTDHENLTRKALGANSDRVYRWRLLLEEFGPEIVYIKGIHNTVADAISRLDFIPKKVDGKTGKMPAMCHSAFMQALADESDIDIHKMKKRDLIKIRKWKAVSKCFVNLSAESEDEESEQSKRTAGTYIERCEIGNAFFNRGNEDQEEIYPPTISEISNA